jgi:hypothetical protein
MSQKNSIIIIVVVLLIAVAGLYFLNKKTIEVPSTVIPVTTVDKEIVLQQLAASSTPAPVASKQSTVLKELAASSTPVSVSEEQKLKILQSLQIGSH